MDKVTPKRNAAARWLTGLVMAVFLISVAHTYTLYDETTDEGQHLAGGMEWLFHHSNDVDVQTPPVANVLSAVVPALFGLRPPPIDGFWTRYTDVEVGHALLLNGDYHRNLYLSRSGTLLSFFFIAYLLWERVRGWLGEGYACLAVCLTCLSAPMLTHTSLANTDIATMAMFFWALDRLWVLGLRPTVSRALLAGLAVGLAFATKFSTGPFLVVSVLIFLISGRWLRHTSVSGWRLPTVRQVLIVAATCAMVIWASYFFSIGRVLAPRGEAQLETRLQGHPYLRPIVMGVADHMPAPAIFRGMRRVNEHARLSSAVYFMGRVHPKGSKWFFPVMFSVKMPLPFVLLTVAGLLLAIRRTIKGQDDLLVFILAGVISPFAIGISSPLNIGLRHVLAAVPFCSMLSVLAVKALWESRSKAIFTRVAVALLIGWQAIEFVSAIPDPLPWFNEIARGRGAWFSEDSDFDWGQDMKRLGPVLQSLHATPIYMAYFHRRDPEGVGIPVWTSLEPNAQVHGWVVIDEASIRFVKGYEWLDAFQPVAHAGQTVRIYHVP